MKRFLQWRSRRQTARIINNIRNPRTTWLPPWFTRWLPAERYRATLMLITGGVLGYASPIFVQAITDRWQFPLEAAKIEQLRTDVERIPCGQAQQVLANVIAANQEIVRKHVEAVLWYTKPFVSSRWLQVQLISVPCEVE